MVGKEFFSDNGVLEHYALALRNIYDELFELNISRDAYRILFHTKNKYVIPSESGVISQMVVEVANNMIHPEDRKRFLLFFDIDRVMTQFASGLKSLVVEFRKLRTTGVHTWAQATLIPVSGSEDKMLICYILDIDERKKAEKKLKDVSEKFIESFGSLYGEILEVDVVTGNTSIVKNIIHPDYENNILPYEEAFNRFIDSGVYSGHIGLLRDEFSLEALTSFINSGKKQKNFEIQYMADNLCYEWLDITAFAISNSDNTDKKIIITTKNINDQKFLKGVVEKFVYDNCDYFVSVDAKRDAYKFFGANKTDTIIPPVNGGSYSEVTIQFANNYIVAEDIDNAIAEMKIERVIAELDRKGEHILYIGMNDINGYRRKKISYIYLDKPNQLILLTRTDVTHVYTEEKRKNDLLISALKQAELASSAKTDFLSRMSHDIRTPMNGIMGMTAIALAKLDDKDRVRDCLGKINTSSQYLLSLINDVLDMSRIESGIMLISENKFDFIEFVHNITTIINPQAGNKGLFFEVTVDEPVSRCYIGDSLRLNQILMNIISNSIKFTPSGGHIRLLIKEKHRADGRALLEFKVSDTGCGMSKDFMTKMYDPFEQEKADIARNQVGSGLGLSIVRNLLNLMGGSVDVISEQGNGTTFTLEFAFNICEDVVLEFEGSDKLEHINVLVIDDDIVTCQHITLLLESLGIQSTWVTSGSEALKLIEEASHGDQKFDTVIVDLKMPGLNGIETTKAIRKILKEDAVVVIMTAYDWGDIEQEARSVGVDGFLAKPLFKKSVFDILLQMKRIASARMALPVGSSRFSGQRVLVVEDSEINMEIAKALLEFENLNVEGAENGQKAVEMFSSSPERYYEAVLMDIRMPIMDGLEATKNIRTSNRAYGAKVPIIAMSANAFQEDIDLALKAGMDHYLIKPLDIEKLYSILDDVLNN